ncbi:MAG: hypothetical protein IH914_03725 [candidate division Zixibacteria bacterium]|nr:hypothetical protein [candidate division Zixibacteria bacterium]
MMTNIFKVYPTVLSVAAFLLFFLTSGPSFGQSLATIGEQDAFSMSGGVMATIADSGPLLRSELSVSKVLEIGAHIAFLSEERRALAFSVAAFPLSFDRTIGLVVSGGVSTGATKGGSGAVVTLGSALFFSKSFPQVFVDLSVGVASNELVGSSFRNGPYTSYTYRFEFGGLSEKESRLFLGITGSIVDEIGESSITVTLGYRIPIRDRNRQEVTSGLPDEFD